MWSPLSYLPASNIGALGAYAPAPQAAPVAAQTPVNQHQLPPHLRGLAGWLAMPNGMMNMFQPSPYQGALGAWRGQMPDKHPMGGRPDDWKQLMMDWQGARPLRANF